jgi:hypothetical protein
MFVGAWREPINQVNALLGLAVAILVAGVALLGLIDLFKEGRH